MKHVLNFRNPFFTLILLLSIGLTFNACTPESSWFDDDVEDTVQGPDNEFGSGPEVDTNNPNDVADNSSVSDGSDSGNEESGDPPATTTNVQHPAKIWGHQSQVEASPDQTIFLPFEFEVSSHADGITDIYVQITGANTYWRIEKYTGASSGQVMLSVKIPSRMKTPGEFQVNYRIQDDMGIVSNVLETTVKVVKIADCSDVYFSGSAGLTVRSVDLGDQAGKVRITYDTKTEPDRVDIFYGGKWVHGTGSSIAYGQAPPKSDCDNPGNGYIGTNVNPGTAIIYDLDYDPNVSRRLDIYVSGCYGGGTFWELWVDCAE